MDIASVVKELRIDWEGVLCDDFDPIPLIKILNKKGSKELFDLYNMYHKVESVMGRLIDANYKIFSDSLAVYAGAFNQNMANIDRVRKNREMCDRVLGVDFDSPVDSRRIKFEICVRELCKAIREYKLILTGVDSAVVGKNYAYASELILRANRIYGEFRLGRIRVLRQMGDRLKERRDGVVKELCCSVISFLTGSEFEFDKTIDAILALDAAAALDACIDNNSYGAIYLAYKRAIFDGSVGDPTDDSVAELVREILHFTNRFYVKVASVAARCSRACPCDEFRILNGKGIARLKSFLLTVLKGFVGLFTLPDVEFISDDAFTLEDTKVDPATSMTGLLPARVDLDEVGMFSRPVSENVNTRMCLVLPFRQRKKYIFSFKDSAGCIEDSELRQSFEQFVDRQMSERYFREVNRRAEVALITSTRERKAYGVDRETGLCNFYGKIDFAEILFRLELNSEGFLSSFFDTIGKKLKGYSFKLFGHTMMRNIIMNSDMALDNGALGRIKKHIERGASIDAVDSEIIEQAACIARTARRLGRIYDESIRVVRSRGNVGPKLDKINSDAGQDCISDALSCLSLSFERKCSDGAGGAFEEECTSENNIINFVIRLYNEGLKVAVAIGLVHEFELFVNNASAGKDSLLFFDAVVVEVWNVVRSLYYFAYVFDCFVFYVEKNVKSIARKFGSGVSTVISNLEMLDEFLSEIKNKSTDGLERAIVLLREAAKKSGGTET